MTDGIGAEESRNGADRASRHPRVVALVPAWQAAAFVEATLDCLAAQSWPNLEVLISVETSDDATPEIVNGYAERHANFRVVIQPERLGWIGNTN